MNFIEYIFATILLLVVSSNNNIYSQISFAELIKDYPENINIIDKPKIEKMEYDSIKITIPYAFVKNNKLRSLIDSLQTVDYDYNSISKPVFIYLMSFSKDVFCAWDISPTSSIGVKDLNVLAYYNVSNLFILFSTSMKKYLKISNRRVAEVSLFGKSVICNVDYIWCGYLKKSEAELNNTLIKVSDNSQQNLFLNKIKEIDL